MKFNTASPSFSQNRPLTLSGKKCIVRTYLSAGEEHHTRKETKRMLFGEKILDYWDDILKDLATVVAIPSVAKPQEGEHP